MKHATKYWKKPPLSAGPHCEFQLNPCTSSPCHNGACRQIDSTRFKCDCHKNFTGDLCDIEMDSCTSHMCAHGTCIDVDQQAVCDCWPAYTGDRCDVRLNYCASKPCVSGECINSTHGFTCKCAPGYIGRRCHLRPCDYLPCHSNARCVDLPVFGATRRSYRCVCPKGLQGTTCSEIKSPCHPGPCENGGECVPFALRDPKNLHAINDDNEDIYEKYTCKCETHYYGENCETYISPDFILEFTKPVIHNYVRVDGPSSDLDQVYYNIAQIALGRQ